MGTTKSPKRVLVVAYEAARAALPPYSSRFSPKKFTQPQLIACLVLKAFLRTDYRGVVASLADSPELASAIGLKRIPHFTTLQKASNRLLQEKSFERLLDAIVAKAVSKGLVRSVVQRAAIDRTGFETRHASHYYVSRQAHTKSGSKQVGYKIQRWPALGLVCDCKSHLALSAWTCQGPSYEPRHFRKALRQAQRRVPCLKLLADAAYDTEAIHRYARLVHGVETVVPPKRHRQSRARNPPPPRQPIRWQMWAAFPKDEYRHRVQVETTYSMIKRHLGSALSARSQGGRSRESLLRTFTHDVMVVLPGQRFSTEPLGS